MHTWQSIKSILRLLIPDFLFPPHCISNYLAPHNQSYTQISSLTCEEIQPMRSLRNLARSFSIRFAKYVNLKQKNQFFIAFKKELDHFPSGSPLRSRSWIPAGGFYIFQILIQGNFVIFTGRVCHVHAVPGLNFNNFRFPVIPQAILRSKSSAPTIFHSEKSSQINLT